MKWPKQLYLNDGNVAIGIDCHGNIVQCVGFDDDGDKTWQLEVTGKELDVIAGRVKLMSDFRKAWKNSPVAIQESHGEGHSIDFDSEESHADQCRIMDGVRFGCQFIDGCGVERVHKLSLAIRSRARAARKSKSSKKR